MAEQQRADEPTEIQASIGSAIKRRGILAAAGAAVAGLLAKQASQPVAATSGTGADGTLVLGSNSTDNTANYASKRTEVISGLTFHGSALLDCSASPFQSSGDANAIGIRGISRGTAAGVFGADYNGNTPAGYPGGMNAGVYGYTYAQGHSGVRGDGGSNGIGVSGVSMNSNAVLGTTLGSLYNQNAAVLGTSANGTGVMGQTTVTGVYGVYGASAAPGGVGVSGNCTGGYGVLGTVSDGYGVLGQANTGNGLYGFSQQNHAIVGQTARPYFGGVFGIATIANTVGIYGSTVNGSAGNVTSAYAGYMDGNFVVANGLKSAAVAHADGTHRLVYCMESPESWLEDFGKAKLVGGKAEVHLDPEFAAIVQTDDYHVFLTAYGNTNGLHVPNQSATGFSVQEHNGGRGSLTFSWRVVAKRKDITPERLAKFDLVGKEKHDVTPPKTPSPVAAPSTLPVTHGP